MERNSPIMISNDNAIVAANAVLIDQHHQQLVAAQIALPAGSQQLGKAIWASLANNGAKSALRIVLDSSSLEDTSMWMQPAKAGYTRISHQASVHTDATLLILVHPLATKPPSTAADYFYCIWPAGADKTPVISRMNECLEFPLLEEWNEYLIQKGLIGGLVLPLLSVGPGWEGIVIEKKPEAWQVIVSDGLKNRAITI